MPPVPGTVASCPMPIIHSGIDEAGYGPILGPLSVAAVSVEVDEGVAVRAAFCRARLGVKDSKEIHDPADLAPLEAVALPGLAWLSGTMPRTAADIFALLGEDGAARTSPWMMGAEDLHLPVAAAPVKTWCLPGVRPRWVGGFLIHPFALNRGFANGVNRADVELGHIGQLLQRLPDEHARHTTVDRLGGRRYYGDFLQGLWPGEVLEVLGERPLRSAYRITWQQHRHEIAFCVDGERASVLTALASCIAKYGRELHMHLFNQHWCRARGGLRPTAGYARDARRWLGEVGGDAVTSYRAALVRGQDDTLIVTSHNNARY